MAKLTAEQANFNDVAKEWADKCEKLIQSWDQYSGFILSTFKLDWSARRVSSRGGWYDGPGINIAMHAATRNRYEGSIYRQYEYPSYDKDPRIGGFYSTKLRHSIGLHVCHEMAHAVQFYADRILNRKIDKPHGDSFKIPYLEIRTALFNPDLSSVGPQSTLQNVYNKYVSTIKTY